MTVLETKPIAVTIYPSGARVIREGNISLKSGKHQLEIKDLTLQMDRESARATVAGSAPSRFLGMQINRLFYADTPKETTRKLEGMLETLQDEMSDVQVKNDLISGERSRLEALAGHTELFATGLISGEIDLDTQLNIFDNLRKRSEHLFSNSLELESHKRVLERRITQVKKQLDQMRNTRSKERNSVLIDVEMLEDGDLKVEINYVVSNATWTPLYDLRLMDKETQHALEIACLAQVTQKTDEDWEDIHLTLSTARPTLASVKPELQPWYIFPQQERQRYMKMAAAPQFELLGRSSDSSADDSQPERILDDMLHSKSIEDIPSEEVTAQINDTGLSISYQVPDTVTIPADGSPHKVNITRINLSPDLDFVTAPRLVEAVYRRLKVLNESPFTFLPGSINLFATDEFIGRTDMDLTAPRGEIELFFGTEDRIKIERELVRKEVDKRLIGGKRRQSIGYEIRLENLLATEASIIVQDQIPVSSHEDIKIRLENITPKPTSQSELGLIDWELNLEAGEKETIRFDYEIEYPQKMRLSGPVY